MITTHTASIWLKNTVNFHNFERPTHVPFTTHSLIQMIMVISIQGLRDVGLCVESETHYYGEVLHLGLSQTSCCLAHIKTQCTCMKSAFSMKEESFNADPQLMSY